MFSLLVVDDEPGHRSGLANMIKELRPDYLVSEAKNGKAALDFLSTNRIDIIITDIKMPIMDGLQFIESLGPKLKEIKVIILSAYSHFEYAQKAIQLGAFDYLLKPFEDEKIIDMLKRVEASLESDASQRYEKRTLESQLENAFPVYLESLLNKWIRGMLQENEFAEIEKIFPFKDFGTIIISELKNFRIVSKNYSGEQAGEILHNIKYWMKDALRPFGHSISFFSQEDKTVMITVINAESELNICADEWHRNLEKFQTDLKTDYNIESLIIVGKVSSDIFSEITGVFTKTQEALAHKFYMKDENIIYYECINRNTNVYVKLKEEDMLGDAIKKKYVEDTVNIIDDISDRILAQGYPDPLEYRQIFSNMLLNQLKGMHNKLNEDDFRLIAGRINHALLQSDEQSDFIKNVKQEAIQIINSLNNQKDRKQDLILNKCLEYIEKNYMQDISLEKLAEIFHFNSNYFSGLFKNYTGVNFSEYLLKLRLEKGKKMLDKTGLKVYEVAEKLGYRDPKYFIKVFKKEFGITPEEYRRMNNQEDL